MNTKFIGVKDFRQNMSTYAKQAREGRARLVVMNRNKPLFEIKPFADDEYLDSFVTAMVEAESDVAAGRVITHEKLLKKLNVD